MRLSLCVCMALLASVAACCADEGARSSLGLQEEEPTSGPFVKTPLGYMVPYSQEIGGSGVSVEMVPVPGGTFLLGSPADEPDRDENEGPQVEVQVAPFWIGKHEVTWAQYKQFMGLYGPFKELQQLRTLVAMSDEVASDLAGLKTLSKQIASPTEGVDAVTCPTPLYSPDATYESGEDPRLPAVTMTPYAAKQYTKWLSAITGLAFRLPCEAEWEYAARGGAKTAYHFGDASEEIDDELNGYAWYDENSDDRAHRVGGKQPNPFGLYDMLGNVAELVLANYDAEGYKDDQSLAAISTIQPATQAKAHAVRGGSWLSETYECRSAVRLETDDKEWKMSDPSLPLSPWWYTETYPAGGIGFRIVRQLSPLTGEQKSRCWEACDEEIQQDVSARLQEGRGVQECIDPTLPTTLEQLQSDTVQELLYFDDE